MMHCKLGCWLHLAWDAPRSTVRYYDGTRWRSRTEATQPACLLKRGVCISLSRSRSIYTSHISLLLYQDSCLRLYVYLHIHLNMYVYSQLHFHLYLKQNLVRCVSLCLYICLRIKVCL